MKVHPRVSVVMPAYNVGAFVGEAVRSVLEQNWPEVELLVMDDGSTDDTAAALERAAAEWRREGRSLVLASQPNRGAPAAINALIERASGDVLCFCDADDAMEPDLLSALVPLLGGDPSLDLAFPGYVYVDEAGEFFGVVSAAPRPRYDAETFFVENPIECSTGACLPMDAVRRAGPFDETLEGCTHLDFFLRVVADRPGNAAGVDRRLVRYRRRRGQITSDWRRMRAAWIKVTAARVAGNDAFGPDALRRARARQSIFWSAIAYQQGDYAASRGLVADAWRSSVAETMRDPQAWVRSAAGLASLLPPPIHRALARGFGRR
ncbi:MAG: glycosyltransferase family A protein [Pseudomonadota bacterium]